MKKRILYLKMLLAALFITTGVSAQMFQQPIKWKHEIVKISEDTYQIKALGKFDADKKEWHIYDLGPYDNGPNPTTFTFEGDESGFELVGKTELLTPSKKVFDEMFGMEIGICEEEVTVSQKIRVTSTADSVSVIAIIEWQACDNQSCLPPTDKEFIFKLPGVTKAKSTAATESAATPSDTEGDKVATPAAKGEDKATSSEPADAETDKADEATSEPAVERAKQEAEVATISAPEEERTGGSIWGVIFEAIAWGFVALLTPCVFPMVPMTVSFFLQQSQGGSEDDEEGDSSSDRRAKGRAKGRALAIFFGVSIIALYTIPIAAIIIITYFAGGEAVTADIFNWLATHWIPNILFFVIFMVFAASFFGAFEIVLPSWLVNRSDSKSDKGGLAGVFFMALTLVLVSFSCTGPIVGTILIKSTRGEIWEPIITMFAFSTAFALPFTIFAFAPSLLNDLPKSGGWLNSVKVVLGFIEVALGFKFLSVADQVYHWGLLDREIYLAIWIVTFTLMGLYLLGKIRFVHDSPMEYLSVGRLTLAIITFSFVVYLIPGMWGAPLKGLSGYLPPISTQDFKLGQKGVDDAQPLGGGTYQMVTQSSASGTLSSQGIVPTYSDFLTLPHGIEGFFRYEEGIEYAKKVNKPVFVDFTGHGCVNCREMEARVWADTRVMKLLKEEFVVIALYADDKARAIEEDWVENDNGRLLKHIGKINSFFAMKRYNVNAQPYYTIIDPVTEENLTTPRGYNLDVELFLEFLTTAIENHKAQ